MEKETAINLLTKIFNYFNPPSRWNFFLINPNQARAEQLYDTVMSTAKVLSVLASAVQHVKEAYLRSQSDQLLYQRSLVHTASVNSNSTEVTVKVGDIDGLLLLEPDVTSIANFPTSKATQPPVSETTIIEQPPNLKFRTGLKNQAKLMKLLAPHLPKGMMLGKAYDQGDCFFDALAQMLNRINNTDLNTTKYLRILCHDFYLHNKALVDSLNASDRCGLEMKDDYYLVQYTAQECEGLLNRRTLIWGRPNVEGKILCRVLSLEAIGVIEILEDPETQKPVISFQQVNQNNTKILSEAEAVIWLNNPKIPILVVEQNSLHFVPLLHESMSDRESLDQANEYSSTVRPKI